MAASRPPGAVSGRLLGLGLGKVIFSRPLLISSSVSSVIHRLLRSLLCSLCVTAFAISPPCSLTRVSSSVVSGCSKKPRRRRQAVNEDPARPWLLGLCPHHSGGGLSGLPGSGSALLPGHTEPAGRSPLGWRGPGAGQQLGLPRSTVAEASLFFLSSQRGLASPRLSPPFWYFPILPLQLTLNREGALYRRHRGVPADPAAGLGSPVHPQ